MLASLPAVSYVEYTATPFANVLIPTRSRVRCSMTSIPCDFITALPQPARYFGAEKVFGRMPDDPDNVRPEEEGLDMVRSVFEDEEKLLQPLSRKDRASLQPVMTGSLERSLFYFLACCAVRRARGDLGKHMSMLVHTSAFVAAHERLASLIRGWIEYEARRSFEAGIGSSECPDRGVER